MRVVGQFETNPIRLGDRIAFGRDTVDGRLKVLVRECVGAQQCPLANFDAWNILLVDVGDHNERRRLTNPEQYGSRFGDLADLAMMAKYGARCRSPQSVALELRFLAGDQRFKLGDFAACPVDGLLARSVPFDEDR